MDCKMETEKTTEKYPVWDVRVTNGIVPIISGNEERMQTAVMAGFIEMGTIPKLDNVGVPWQAFLSGKITFGELDASIRTSIRSAGVEEFYPQYEIKNDKITMTVGTVMEEQ